MCHLLRSQVASELRHWCQAAGTSHAPMHPFPCPPHPYGGACASCAFSPSSLSSSSAAPAQGCQTCCVPASAPLCPPDSLRHTSSEIHDRPWSEHPAEQIRGCVRARACVQSAGSNQEGDECCSPAFGDRSPLSPAAAAAAGLDADAPRASSARSLSARASSACFCFCASCPPSSSAPGSDL